MPPPVTSGITSSKVDPLIDAYLVWIKLLPCKFKDSSESRWLEVSKEWGMGDSIEGLSLTGLKYPACKPDLRLSTFETLLCFKLFFWRNLEVLLD